MVVTAKDGNRNDWYLGLVVGPDEFQEHQNNIDQSKKARSVHVNGWGLYGADGDLALASTPPDLLMNVAPARMLTPDGHIVEWTTSESINVGTATAGSPQGDTSATTVGTKRYIVTTVVHEYEDTEGRTDDLGAPVFYRQVSKAAFYTWMSSEVTAADDPITSTILRNLLTQIVAANHAPIGLAVRAEGVSSIDNANMYPLPRLVLPFGENADDAKQLEQHLLGAGGLGLPLTLTTNGELALSAVAVGGQPGKIVLTGGERIAFAIPADLSFNNQYAEDAYGNRIIVKTIPTSEEINFPAQSTTYIVRCYVDPKTLDIVFYKGTGDFPNDPSASNNAHGTDGAAFSGFLPTWIDIPIAVVTTGLNGTAPTIDQIVSNDWKSKLAYIQQQADLVNSKVSTTDIAPIVDEYKLRDQPYIYTTKSAAFMTDAGGLDLRVYQMEVYRGHTDGVTSVPPGATPSVDVALIDNAINLVYADMTANPPDVKTADAIAGAGPSANPKHVMLGVVLTAGGNISKIVQSPTDRATALVEDVRASFMQIVNNADLYIGPTTARQMIGRSSGSESEPSTVYQSPFTTRVDKTNLVNWVAQTIDAAAGWKYIYADPGGQHFGDVALVKYKLDATPPNYLGRHPSDLNLLYLGAAYLDGSSNWRKMYKSGDVTMQQRVIALTSGNAAVSTAINLGSMIPLTAHSVFILVYSKLGGAPATLDTTFKRLIGDAEYSRVQFTGVASDIQTSAIIEVPVEWNAGAPRIFYENIVGGGGGNSVDVSVVGYREKRKGNANEDNPITVIY